MIADLRGWFCTKYLQAHYNWLEFKVLFLLNSKKRKFLSAHQIIYFFLQALCTTLTDWDATYWWKKAEVHISISFSRGDIHLPIPCMWKENRKSHTGPYTSVKYSVCKHTTYMSVNNWLCKHTTYMSVNNWLCKHQLMKILNWNAVCGRNFVVQKYFYQFRITSHILCT